MPTGKKYYNSVLSVKMAPTSRNKKIKSKTNGAIVQKHKCPSSSQVTYANSVTNVMEAFTAFKTLHVKKKPRQEHIVFDLQDYHAEDLSSNLRDTIFNLFEDNMKELYVKYADGGYDAGQKYDELFEVSARYLLVWTRSEENACARDTEIATANLCAFVHFRFVEEDGASIMYLYELQVCKSAQRMGLGKHLMQVLMLIGNSLKMDMLVLTVFKENYAAMDFYKKLNFEIDETSPSFCGDDSQSYEILSRSLQR